jgi:cytochrome c oxidase cbb3-type subunit III
MISRKEPSEHEYDGIREQNNPLPGWWFASFYLTVLFSAGYVAYYWLGPGDSIQEEFERARKETELASLKAAPPTALTEGDLLPFLRDPQKLKAGSRIFAVRCVSCHGSAGQGGIGPNLTDRYWLHGGSLTQVAATITNGVSERGMPAWGPVLEPAELKAVVVFVRSLRGTHPPNPKPPEGTLEAD